ncbi:hypothetical protein A0H81_06835 [Grifola frondosa]|uniref:G protein-coupled receptor n=1 Tax=Grifola frondosa TaxID=5627 RepID=A0A1C7M8R8_GRIFR|nr:hypothetical protein A0H81_06835 [Grifola frondosa]
MSDALFQHSYYLAINFNDILYGVELVLYCMTMQILLQDTKRTTSRTFFMFFSTVLLFLITIYMSTEAVFGEEMWIVNADYPGGSAAWFAANASVWYQTMGTTASVILNLFSDALLIYRCYILWTDYRVIVFPSLLYLASLGLGIVELFISGSPNGDFFAGEAAKLGTAYYTSTITLNITATCIICGRIIYLGRGIESTARGRHAARYTGTMSIVVESALPYSLSGIAFLVSYGMGSQISILFGAFYGMFTCISPQMIILRVIKGHAWTKDKTAETALALQSIGTSHDQGAATNIDIEVGSRSDMKSDGGSVRGT